MRQPTFGDLEYESKKRKTRREIFLERMDGLIPWGMLEELIRPYYPKAGRGRRPYELSAMLRIHCVQLFYNLSDPGMEDLLYEAESVRRFVGLRLSGPLPDETTILNFRHLLEEHELGEGLMEEINRHLATQGLRLREGTIKGVGKREENEGLDVEWRVAMRPGRRRQLEPGSEEAVEERRKASIRAKVEHPFLWVKRRFGYAKVRYRGLAKNTQRLALLLGLTNLIRAEGYLAA